MPLGREGALDSGPCCRYIACEMMTDYWAKSLPDGSPGLSVRDHCVNVGMVVDAIVSTLPDSVAALIPSGAATLGALHDIGKISPGFQAKCRKWLSEHNLDETAIRQRWFSRENAEQDHAKISQAFIYQLLKPAGTHGWSVSAGVHHGRIFGRRVPPYPVVSECESWEGDARRTLCKELINIFGNLPEHPPRKDDADLWCVAGLIAIADWIGSNEAFFPVAHGLSIEESREAATKALRKLGWNRGRMRKAAFGALFNAFTPNPLQQVVHDHSFGQSLIVVEGPMGCGKTEAALWAAHRLNVSGENAGLYFALPTQVTSNRVHRRVAKFLVGSLEESSHLRLAHGSSWLEDDHTVLLHPATTGDWEDEEHVREGRSWFASSKHALLAPYGVGTIDQALQGVVAVKHFFVRRFGLAGKVVILDEIHSYDVYTSALIIRLIQELLELNCTVIVLSATLTLARRKELIKAAGGDLDTVRATEYPLISVVRPGQAVEEVPVTGGISRTVKVKTAALSPQEIIGECIARAEAGQHVLYLRNTVVEAQATCLAMISAVREDRAEVGLLHSRFPFFRRQELEEYWLERLGRERASDGKGSILIATQVVEQSVDLDLDFIVTDLAPTDMLLQRMGRLWRHERPNRLVAEPEFWINTPDLPSMANARELRTALGKSGLVYAPYILLRTAAVFNTRTAVSLPDEIRDLLEATYAEQIAEEEGPGWRELRDQLEREREVQIRQACSATKVFGQQSQEDAEGLLTRRAGAPMKDVVLLLSCEVIDRERWKLIPLNGEPVIVSGYVWDKEVARVLHRHLVRAPRFVVPPQEVPPWLSLHVHGAASWALVQQDGSCEFPEAVGNSAVAYSALLGLHSRPGLPQAHYTDDDDEFDY